LRQNREKFGFSFLSRPITHFFLLYSLWMESHRDLRLTLADSALAQGGRRPVRPTGKDGLVLQVGSSAAPGPRLLELDRETGPLRRLDSCSYKRTSAEPDFRKAGLAVDWCSFRLLNSSRAVGSGPGRLPQPPAGILPAGGFISRAAVERRSSPQSLLLSLLFPVLLFVILNGLLGCILAWDAASSSSKEKKSSAGSFINALFGVVAGCTETSPEKTAHQAVVLPGSSVANINSSDNNNDVNANNSSSCHSSSPSVPDLQQVGGGDPRSPRASSVQRQTETLRSLGRRRDVTPRLHQQNWERSSLHSRSRTASPCPSALTEGRAPHCTTQVV
jgi:hypothetical protein